MFPIPVEWSSPAMETAAAIVYVLLALVVTIDVLLKKSDVRSRAGLDRGGLAGARFSARSSIICSASTG